MHAVDIDACENCAAPLQGAYCHACGQHAVNPLRDLGHAVEEVFESFWHLDGRVFRTLRELCVPGRVACNYLAGQRVRYIAPLRLFVILTVLTFFVGQIAASTVVEDEDEGAAGNVVRLNDDTGSGHPIRNATTEAEVDAALARELDELRKARESAGFVPGVAAGLSEAESRMRLIAAQRISTLRARDAAARGTAGAVADAGNAAAAAGIASDAAKAARAVPAAAPAPGSSAREETRKGLQKVAAMLGPVRDPKAVWHERDNPVDVAWLPSFADGWFNRRLANMEHNVERIERDGGARVVAQLVLAAVPPALFVLLPVFALLLKMLYVFTGRGYLEHLVVALYSHAALLLALLVTFVLVLLRAGVTASGLPDGPGDVLRGGFWLLQATLWLGLPVYLFVMQQRVYGQHRLVTAAKYAVLGLAYFFLVAAVALYGVFAGLTSGS